MLAAHEKERSLTVLFGVNGACLVLISTPPGIDCFTGIDSVHELLPAGYE